MVGIIDLVIVTFIPFLFIYLLDFLLPKKISENLKEDENKYTSIDGLRGLSAILVIIHHTLVSWAYFYFDKIWHRKSFTAIFDETVSEKVVTALTLLGEIGVCFFFMITGFLFYDKLIKSKGKIDPSNFFIKRFFRIAPLYYFVILLVFITVFLTGVSEFKSLTHGFYSFCSWLMFGILDVKTISSMISDSWLVAGVIWTLAIEWQFYVFVPVFSVFVRNKRISFVFIFVAFVAFFLMFNFDKEFDIRTILPFLFGMLSTLFVNYYKPRIFKISKSFFSVVALILFWHILVNCDSKHVLNFFVALGILFILISNGNTVFGILSSKIFIMLGKISYSTYLIHGLVLFWINGALMKNSNYLINSVIAILLTLIISVFTYYYIERKGMSYGKKISR